MFGPRRAMRGDGGAGDDPDPYLAPLGRDEAAALVASTRRAFGELGVRTAYEEGSLVVPGGRGGYGLYNLAVRVAGLSEDERESIVRDHVAALLVDDVLPTGEDARRCLVLQLRPVDQVPGGPPAGAPEILPGIVGLAGFDLRTKVHLFAHDDQVDPHGGWDAVVEAAHENLRRMPIPQHEVLHPEEGDPDSAVHVFTSDEADLLGASRVLVIDDLLERAGVEVGPHGLLVVLPNRHLLAVHVLRGAEVLAAVRVLVAIADGESSGTPGPLSDELFYLPPDGPAEQITRREDGRRIVAVDGALAEAFADLGLLEDE